MHRRPPLLEKNSSEKRSVDEREEFEWKAHMAVRVGNKSVRRQRKSIAGIGFICKETRDTRSSAQAALTGVFRVW